MIINTCFRATIVNVVYTSSVMVSSSLDFKIWTLSSDNKTRIYVFFYLFLFGFPILSLIIICFFSCLIIGKMDNNQERVRHGRLAQHASVCKENVRPSLAAVRETSFDVKVSSSHVQLSLTSSS